MHPQIGHILHGNVPSPAPPPCWGTHIGSTAFPKPPDHLSLSQRWFQVGNSMLGVSQPQHPLPSQG